MNDSLATVKFHGDLGKSIGRDTWKLAVQSVGEAINAVENQCKILCKKLMENDKKNIKYRVLINGKDFVHENEKNINKFEGLETSELAMKREIETIDIIPVVEGAGGDGGLFETIIGAVLIVAGLLVMGSFLGVAFPYLGPSLIMAGVGLMAAGIANLLTPMPEFDDFRQIEGGGRPSYLFSGPANVIREGGPVFIGYGQLLVGSQVIQSTIETVDELNGNFMNLQADKLTFTPYPKYWGFEGYGLDYGNDFRDGIKGDEEMRRRAKIVSDKTLLDGCGPAGNPTVGGKKSVLTSDGDDYINFSEEGLEGHEDADGFRIVNGKRVFVVDEGYGYD